MRIPAIRYGPERGQIADLYRPDGASRKQVPVVVLIHGGYWRTYFTKALMRRMARAVAANGWAAWNIEYGRVGAGGRGGWPNTFLDVAAAIDRLHGIDGLDLGRVVVCGHSAGGTMALWAAGRARLPDGAPGTSPAVALQGVVALAPAVDLRRVASGGGPSDPIPRLLGGMPDEVSERYALASPWERLPLGVPQVLVHGAADQTIAPQVSERYVKRALDAGDDAVYEPVPLVTHRGIIAAPGPAWAVVATHLERLLNG